MGLFFSRKNQKANSMPDTYHCKFSIKANTIPAPVGYDQLNEAEQHFLREFERALEAAKLSPYGITLTRLNSGMFNVSYSSGYIGKIDLRPKRNGGFYYMQYLGPRDSVKEISTSTLDDYISAIPLWIQTIKRCERIRKRALRV